MVVVKGKVHEKVRIQIYPPPPPAYLFNKYLLVLVNTYILCASSCSKGFTKMNLFDTQEKSTTMTPMLLMRKLRYKLVTQLSPSQIISQGWGWIPNPGRLAPESCSENSSFTVRIYHTFSSVKNLHIKKQNLLHCKKIINHSRHIQANTYPIYLYVITLSQESATLGIPVFL